MGSNQKSYSYCTPTCTTSSGAPPSGGTITICATSTPSRKALRWMTSWIDSARVIGLPVAGSSRVRPVTANLAGLPGLVLPVGQARSGLPLAAQLLAGRFREESLFRAGAVLERAFPAAAPPDLDEATENLGETE